MFELSQPGALSIFVITLALSLFGLLKAPWIIDRSLFRPYRFVRNKEYYTAISSGLVHADMGHLLFNMLTFYFFAFALEYRLGTPRFVALYLFGLLLSSVCTYVKHRNNPNYASLGASGAISAVLFAFIVYDPLSTLFIIPIPVPIPAFLFAFGYLAYTWWSARQQRGRINHDAHLCGALAGLLFVFITDPSAYQRLLSIVL